MGSDKTIGSGAAIPTMAFRLFLLCSFVLLARPQDILTFLQPMRPALLFTILAIGALVLGGRLKELTAALSAPESKRYLLFYSIMILGIPFAYNLGTAFHGVLTGYVVNVLFFVLLVSQVTSMERLKGLIWVICLSTVTYSVFGGLLQSGGFAEGRMEVVGSAFDPNDTAYVLVSLFPLSLYFVRFDEGRLKRFVAIAAIFSSVAVILQTGSRGGILALGIVLLIVLLTKAGGIEKGHKIFLIFILASTWLFMGDRVDVDRYRTLFDLSSDYNVTGEEGRLNVWQGAIDLAVANPVTGVGVECFSFAWGVTRQLSGQSNIKWKSIHNSFLQVAVEVGLIGFGIFMLINLRSVLTFFRISRIRLQMQSRESRELSSMGGLMLVGFLGLLASGFFISQGYSIFSTLYFALAAALLRIKGVHTVADSCKEMPTESRTIQA